MNCCTPQKTTQKTAQAPRPAPSRNYGAWAVAGSLVLVSALLIKNGFRNREAQTAAIAPQSQQDSETDCPGCEGGNAVSLQQGGEDMSSHHGGSQQKSPEIANALIGSAIPSFSLSDRDGNSYTPETLRGKKAVLFFNEGLMCYPSCWQQIAEFGKDERFKQSDVLAISVVVDPKSEWQKAESKMPELTKAITVFDEGGAASKKLGMTVTASSMHPGSLPGHTYVLLDKNGVVRSVIDDPQMAMHTDHVAEELAKI